jgi:hypothetical protein
LLYILKRFSLALTRTVPALGTTKFHTLLSKSKNDSPSQRLLWQCQSNSFFSVSCLQYIHFVVVLSNARKFPIQIFMKMTLSNQDDKKSHERFRKIAFHSIRHIGIQMEMLNLSSNGKNKLTTEMRPRFVTRFVKCRFRLMLTQSAILCCTWRSVNSRVTEICSRAEMEINN